MPKQTRVITKFDPDFRFLVDLDPAMQIWQGWAAKYWATIEKSSNKQTAFSQFFVTYLFGQGLHRLLPEEFFAVGQELPPLDGALGIATLTKKALHAKYDTVSDFLDWVLREKLAEPDADGHFVVPAQLTNPFPRRRPKVQDKQSDLSFAHVLMLDPKLEDWRALVAEWMRTQKTNVSTRRIALDHFLVTYLHGYNLERNPVKFLLRETVNPDYMAVLIGKKSRGTSTMSAEDVKRNNYVADFCDWLLCDKLGDETGQWDTFRFHNPIQRLSSAGLATAPESNKQALSIRYIKELRGMLAQGPNFRDWTWAQHAMAQVGSGGDWFLVNKESIHQDDPDCVWRERETSSYERENKGYSDWVFEIWSPVRATALYLKLELPLRTMQVRMLDSGEADTWRYVHRSQGGKFVLNDSPLATGNEKRPYQRGVFHRSQMESGAGLYINTNKSADINKAENDKGYVIPWAHEEALYWLEKLRNWQERYNPITKPTAWVDLGSSYFSRTPPHPEVLEQRGSACFLMRDPTADESDKPITDDVLSRFWFKLLVKLEEACAARGETLDDGTPIRFVDQESEKGTYFSLHALRVSLISYLILDLNLPVAVVSKLIAGHARIIMTLYYTKFGKAYMREVMEQAEKRQLEAEQANHRRFLMDANFEQISQRFAYISEDAARAAIRNRSAAAFVFEDKGICPTSGTHCDIGGEQIGTESLKHFAPVPGYPQERNCVRCRFFLTGPAFLPGLQAHFNTISEKMHRQSERYNRMQNELNLLEQQRFECRQNGVPFAQASDLERASQRLEADAEATGKLINDMQATYHLIERSIQIAGSGQTDGIQLVTQGNLTDIQSGWIETQSELHQLEVICENAVIYAETDADRASLRRGQILDAMLRYNGMEPVFLYLTPDQQLLAGNAVMKLIQARSGSISGALPYAECRSKLKNLGLLEEVQDEITKVAAGTPATALIERVRRKKVEWPQEGV